MSFLTFLLAVGLLIWYRALSRRVREMETKHTKELNSLGNRVEALGRRVVELGAGRTLGDTPQTRVVTEDVTKTPSPLTIVLPAAPDAPSTPSPPAATPPLPRPTETPAATTKPVVPVAKPVPALAPAEPVLEQPTVVERQRSMGDPTVFGSVLLEYDDRGNVVRETDPNGKLARRQQLLDLEETLGANWLLKIGMAILIIGVALFLGYTVQRMGPWGKVLLGSVISVAAVAGGSSLEHRSRYQAFGRVLLSGGWALAYFLAYAMHSVEATKVVQDESLGFALLLGVAAGIVIHSLRYRSQFVTGFAVALGYFTIIFYGVESYTLLATLVLSLAVVIVLWKMDWYGLESIAVVGTYANHYAWLRPIIEPMGAEKGAFAEYSMSTALLTCYWVLFTVSHFLRRGKNEQQDAFLGLAVILNVLGYWALSGYQSYHPEWRFWFFSVFGSVYFALAFLGQRLGRRSSYLLLSTIGGFLVVAAAPYLSVYYAAAADHWVVMWLLACQIFLIVGYRLEEIHFRRLAWLTTFPLTAYLISYRVIPRLGQKGFLELEDGILLAVTATAFFFNTLYLGRKYASQIQTEPEKALITTYLYLGWLMALAGTWLLTPSEWLVIIWLSLGFLLYSGYRKWGQTHLSQISHFTLISAVARIAIISYPQLWDELYREPAWNTSAGVLIAASVMLYVFYENRRGVQPTLEAGEIRMTSPFLFTLYSYVAWATVIGTSWLILPRAWWSVGLAAGVWVFHAPGLWRHDFHLRLHAQLTALLAAARVVFVDLPSEGNAPRTLVAGAVAVVLYLYGEAARRAPLSHGADGQLQHWLNASAATLILALLMWYELSPLGVAIGWGVLTLALVEIGRASGRPDFRWQGHLLAGATFVRLLVANLNTLDQFGPVSARLASTAPLIVLFYYLFAVVRSDALAGKLTSGESSRDVPAFYSSFGLIALLAILRFELTQAWVAIAWAVVAVLMTGVGRWSQVGEFRIQGVLVALLVLLRAVFENFYLVGSLRALTVGVVAAVLLAGYAFATAFPDERKGEALPGSQWFRRLVRTCDQSARHFFFFSAAGLVTVLLGLEFRLGASLTAGWAVEALAIFVFGMLVKERSYRLFALALLLLSTAKIVVLDVWRLETLERIVAFIVLGSVLVLVSFFYTRYREAWRRLVLDR
jgi:hypothetical protein